MFCKKCGKQISDGVQFCPNCGASQESSAKEENAVFYKPNKIIKYSNKNLTLQNTAKIPH